MQRVGGLHARKNQRFVSHGEVSKSAGFMPRRTASFKFWRERVAPAGVPIPKFASLDIGRRANFGIERTPASY
jgi:hypothetical protein